MKYNYICRIPKMVHYIVAGAGGIPPVPRQRARQALTLSEREVISRGVARGLSLRQISRDMGRAPSTVSREVRRHGGPRRYRVADADRRAWARGQRPKRCRLATHSPGRRLPGGCRVRTEFGIESCNRPASRYLNPLRRRFISQLRSISARDRAGETPTTPPTVSTHRSHHRS